MTSVADAVANEKRAAPESATGKIGDQGRFGYVDGRVRSGAGYLEAGHLVADRQRKKESHKRLLG